MADSEEGQVPHVQKPDDLADTLPSHSLPEPDLPSPSVEPDMFPTPLSLPQPFTGLGSQVEYSAEPLALALGPPSSDDWLPSAAAVDGEGVVYHRMVRI